MLYSAKTYLWNTRGNSACLGKIQNSIPVLPTGFLWCNLQEQYEVQVCYDLKENKVVFNCKDVFSGYWKGTLGINVKTETTAGGVFQKRCS